MEKKSLKAHMKLFDPKKQTQLNNLPPIVIPNRCNSLNFLSMAMLRK